MEITIITQSDPAQNAMDLAVTPGDGSIEVSSGNVTLQGQQHVIGSLSFPVTSRSVPTVIFGYLVRDVTTGHMEHYVDEWVQDGFGTRKSFGRADTKQLVVYLFHLVLPADTVDLTSIDFTRWRIVAPS